MRSIRWKSRYLQGNAEIDRRNKKLVGCFNQLLETAGQKEHCQEMERFLTQTGADLESYLQPDNASNELNELADKNFYTNMLQALPLSPYGTMACRKCGLCDIAQAKIAQHLQEPLACLEEFSSGPKVD